jgi:hypothetical protein
MSWLYRFLSKSDNEQVVTIAAPYVQITGGATITGNLAVTGDTTYIGAYDITGVMDTDYLQVDAIATTTWLRCPNTASLTTISATTVTVSGRVDSAWVGVTNTATAGTVNATTANITGVNTLGWATVTNTATMVTGRVWTGPVYLGSGTVAIIWGGSTVDPIATGAVNVGGATGYDKGSLYIGGTAGLYVKTDYASTSWASIGKYSEVT